MSTPAASRPVLLGLRRGAAMRCPNCGRGRLYRKYLKVMPCDACGNDNTVYPSDDAPPYFTILIVGHVVIAPMLLSPLIWRQPAALVAAVTLPILLAVTLATLPLVKGAVVGLQWALRQHSGEPEPLP